MTRTERDVRAVLEASEQQAPDPTAVLDALKRRIVTRGRRRRTTAVYLAAAVAVGAVAILPTVVRSSGLGGVAAATPTVDASIEPSVSASASPSPSPPPSSVPSPAAAVHRPVLSFTIRSSDVGDGMRIQPFVISANRQWATVRQPGVVKGRSAELYVYEPGRADVNRYLSGDPVSVNGHPGYFKVATDPDTFGTTYTTDRATVVWQYTPGAWAIVMSTQDSVQQPDLLRIASALVVDTPVGGRVPFKLTYLPSSWKAIRMSQNLMDPANPSASVTFDVPGADTSTMDHEAGYVRPLDIVAMPAVPRQWNPTGTVAGHPMMHLTVSQTVVDVGGWWIMLTTGTGRPLLTDAELEAIMGSMTVATLSDPSTWFDATTAVPGGTA